MGLDLKKARNAYYDQGLSQEQADEKIAQFLSEKSGFNLSEGIKAGQTTTQIAEYLSERASQKEAGPELIQAPPAWKTKISEAAHEIIPAIGMIPAAVTGLATGTVFGGGSAGGVAGALSLGGVGYAAGEAFTDTFVDDLLLGLNTRRRETYKGKGIKESLIQAGKQVGGDILKGAVYEGTGRASVPIIQTALKPLTPALERISGLKTLVAEKPEYSEIVGLYKKYDMQPMPTEIMPQDQIGTKTLSLLEGVLGYRPVSGDVMLQTAARRVMQMNKVLADLKTKGGTAPEIERVGSLIRREAKDILTKYTDMAPERINKVADKFVFGYGTKATPYESGTVMKELFQADKAERKGIVEDLYNGVGELLGDAQFQPNIPVSGETKSIASQLFKEEMAQAPSYRNNKILARLRPFISDDQLSGLTKEEMTFLQNIKGAEEAYLQAGAQTADSLNSWAGLKKMRTVLMNESRGIKGKPGGFGTEETRVYDLLEEAILNDQEKFAQSVGGNVWETYQAARAANTELRTLYDKDVVKLMGMDPKGIVSKIVNNNEVTLLNKIDNILGPEGVEPVRRAYVKEIFKSATKDGRLNPKRLEALIDGTAPETLNKLLNPNQVKELRNVIQGASHINSKYMGRQKSMETLQFLGDLVGTSNPDVVKAIFKPNNRRLIKLARRLLTPARMRDVKTKAIEKVLKASGTGDFLPVSSSKEFSKYSTTLKELLDPKEFKDLSGFLRLGQNASRVEKLWKNASQTGQILIGNSVMKNVLTNWKGIGLTLGVPYVLARVYTSKPALRYMTTAIRLPQASRAATEAFVKAVTIALTTDEPELVQEGPLGRGAAPVLPSQRQPTEQLPPAITPRPAPPPVGLQGLRGTSTL